MADTKILIEVGAKNTTQRTFDQVQKSMKQTHAYKKNPTNVGLDAI